MFPTLEVRWFYRGTIPPEVEAWFQEAGRELTDQPLRTDYYLRPHHEESLGIKLREGRIEIKQRLHEYGAARFHDRVEGTLEGWIKWSFGLAQSHGDLARMLGPDWAWMQVEKERKLRRYRLAEGQGMAAVATTEWPERGCDFELTTVRIGREVWWSLCLEAFGREATLRENLLMVARHVLATDPPLALETPDSYGYPRWLEMVGAA